jgi:hypothetical protein
VAGAPAFRGLKAETAGGASAWRVSVSVGDRTFVWEEPTVFDGPRGACIAAQALRERWAEGRVHSVGEAPWSEVASKPSAGGVHEHLGGPAIPAELFLGAAAAPRSAGMRVG